MKRITFSLLILLSMTLICCQEEFNRMAWKKAETIRGEYTLVNMAFTDFPAKMDLNGDGEANDPYKEIQSFENTVWAKGQIEFDNTLDETKPYRAGFNVDFPVQGIWDETDPAYNIGSGSIVPLNLHFYVLKDGSLEFEDFEGFGIAPDVLAQLALKTITDAEVRETEKGFDVKVWKYPAYDFISEKIYYGTVTLSLEKKL